MRPLRLTGQVEADLSATGQDQYYTDWGTRTEADALSDAEAKARRGVEEAGRARVRQAKDEAEARASGNLDAEARARAQDRLQRDSAARRAELDERARDELETVGMLARQEFYRVMAIAYRQAILAYASTHGAEDIQCSEDGDVMEIEFMFNG